MGREMFGDCGCCWLMEAKFFDLFLIFFVQWGKLKAKEKFQN